VKLRIGYELDYEFPQPTPLILMLNVHFSRFSDLETPDYMRLIPSVPVSAYRDGFGNWCTRLLAPQGFMRITADAIISDSGLPEVHLQFKAEVFGGLHLRLVKRSDGLVASFGVADAAARRAVAGHVDDLIGRLRARGFAVVAHSLEILGETR
jgi:hypothetical protein